MISNLRILFARREDTKYYSDVGNMPNVLGRDVLTPMSIGCCRTNDYLFLTGRNQEYYDALAPVFPPP